MRHFIFGIVSMPLIAGGALAQEFDPALLEFEAGLSTQGLSIAPSYEIMPDVSIRAPIYFGSLDETFDDDGTTLEGSVDFQSFAIMADYYPFQNGFRVSAGLAIGGTEFSGSTDELELNGEAYAGDFTATIAQENDTAPVLSVGWVRSITDQFGFYSELGARFTGFDLSVAGQEALDDATRAEFDADLAEANSDLDQLTFIPYSSFGVVFSF